jgi:uncharacterized membrane protein
MIKINKNSLLLLAFQAISLIALLSLFVHRAAYGHANNSSIIMVFAWICIASCFCWIITAAVQLFNGSRQIAYINIIIALAVIFAAAHLMPYLAK